jgi:hypothetical protein
MLPTYFIAFLALYITAASCCVTDAECPITAPRCLADATCGPCTENTQCSSKIKIAVCNTDNGRCMGVPPPEPKFLILPSALIGLLVFGAMIVVTIVFILLAMIYSAKHATNLGTTNRNLTNKTNATNSSSQSTKG